MTGELGASRGNPLGAVEAAAKEEEFNAPGGDKGAVKENEGVKKWG